MKSICRAIREFFHGPDEVTPPAPAPENPPVETFCRTNRFTEWQKAMEKDIAVIGAKFIAIKCYDDPVEYRAAFRNTFDENTPGHTVFWNTVTLKPVRLIELFNKGVEEGHYYNNEEVEYENRADHELTESQKKERAKKQDPTKYECIARFTNHVVYRPRSHYSSYHLHIMMRHHSGKKETMEGTGGRTKLGAKWKERYALAKEWNDHQLVYLGEHDGRPLCLEPDAIDHLWFNTAGTYQARLISVDIDEKKDHLPYEIPLFCARPFLNKVEELRFMHRDTFEISELFDPIRVRELAPDEEHGLEAYVALVPGKQKDTYTRIRYRVEVDSEHLYKGVICNLVTLYKGVAHRLLLEGANDDGKLYVDNIHFMCVDGTEHTADPAGFSSIGAEPYYDGRERTFRNRSRGHDHPSGPFLITNQDFPTKPIY